MHIARLGPVGSEIPVARGGGKTFDLRGITADIDGGFFAGGGIGIAAEALAGGGLPEIADASQLRVGAPIVYPGKILCVGLNYRDHAAETGADIPAEPILFMKDPLTVVGPYDDVLIPRRSLKTDWEIELGVVMGRTARYLDSPLDAMACVAGFVVSHDVSERAFQLERGGQWDKGKSCETFNPLGPALVTPDEVRDPQSLGLSLSVNGTQRQNGSTSDMIFSVAEIIWYASQFMVLRAGDLINTGTPAGVALGIPGNPYLRDGDVVELEIDVLGTARQRFVQA